MKKLIQHSLIILYSMLFMPLAWSGTDKGITLSSISELNDKEKTALINELKIEGDSLYEIDQYNEAIGAYKKAEQVMVHSSLEKESSIIFYDLGYTYYMLDSMSQSVKYFRAYLELSDHIKPTRRGNIYKKLSKAQRNLGNAEEAFEYQIQNLRLREELKDTVQIGNSIYQLGSIQFSQGNYDEALKYYKEALEINYVLNDSFTLFSCLAAIGGTYNRLGDLDNATRFNNEALAITLAIDYKTGMAYAYHNLAADHHVKREYNKSLGYAMISLGIKEQNNDNWGLSDSYRMIGLNHMKLNQLNDAEKYLNLAYTKAEELDSKVQMVEALESCAKLAEKKGDFENKSFYLEQLLITKKNLMNESIQRNIEDSKNNYEIYKRDKKINTLKKNSEVQQIKTNTYSIILALAIPLILLLGYTQYRLKRSNNLMVSKNDLIKKQNIALEESNKALEKSNTELEQFAYIASHDMREPIRTIRSFNSLLQKKYSGALGDRGMEFVTFIEDASARLDIMLTDLLNYSRVNTKDKNKSFTNLSQSVNAAAKNLNGKITNNDVILNVALLPKVNVNQVQMERLFQNLIDNGIKYNNNKEKVIDINYHKNDSAHVFSVKDNGIGIEPQYKEKVFEIFRRLHSRSEYEGSGIGLATCKKIVEKHNGEIWLKSYPNKGTTVYFSIPISKDQPSALAS